jgi:glycosyltransferase involved in cell wall biosynthesis
MGNKSGLVAIETHPIQYHAPIYRTLQATYDIPVTAIYGSDFSVAGYNDLEFQSTFAWDIDLLAGYTSIFLSRLSTGGASSAATVTASGLGKAVKKVAPKAILLTGYSPRFYQHALLTAWQSHCPILFRAETTDFAKTRASWRKWIRDLLLSSLYRYCQKLLYVGKNSKAHYTRLGCPDSKLVFSPYCVDTTHFRCGEDERLRVRSSIRESLGITNSQSVILFSGKLVYRKAPDLLIQAIKVLPSDIRDQLVVIFLGNGEMTESLREMVGQSPTVLTHFVGFQNQTALSPYYHSADILVLPSRHSETWGLVVNEALHHGLPSVVSGRVGCAADLIEPGRTGEIFSELTPDDLANALRKALALTGRLDVRTWCRNIVQNYTVDKASAGIAQAYLSILESDTLR